MEVTYCFVVRPVSPRHTDIAPKKNPNPLTLPSFFSGSTNSQFCVRNAVVPHCAQAFVWTPLLLKPTNKRFPSSSSSSFRRSSPLNSTVYNTKSVLMVQAASHGGGGKAHKTDVEVGGFYQISHENLPPRTPFWLKSIRVVMVSDKNRLKITIRFPSKQSLDNYSWKGKSCLSPDLDMCFIMGMKLARRVLIRQVTYPDFDNLEDLKGFWMLNTLLVPKLELEDVSTKYMSSSTIDSEEEKVDEIDNKRALDLVVKEETVDDELLVDENQKKKKYKWWSSESFATGEKVILKILKEKKAVADNPIYRAALRKEAQKEIGNTGLLDHLLKDIPGRVAPDGISRFQRCYNANGVIMYWLESADLVDIRKKAGVADPFWIPPPGWKQGGCSAGCPCAEELEILKEDLSKVKSELEETKRQLNEVRNADVRCCDCSKWVGGFW